MLFNGKNSKVCVFKGIVADWKNLLLTLLFTVNIDTLDIGFELLFITRREMS